MSRQRGTAILLVAVSLSVVLSASLPLAVMAAHNDERGSAALITSLPYFDGQDTSLSASADPSDPTDCVHPSPTVWYRLEPAGTIGVVAHTMGSDFDTMLAAYEELSDGSLEMVACNDDWFGLQAQIFFIAQGGSAYLILAGGFGGQSGNLAFTAEESEGDPGFPHDPDDPWAPLELSVTVDRGRVDRHGNVTLDGTIMCSQPATAYVEGDIRQRVGRQYVFAYIGTLTECGPEPTGWTATSFYNSGVFVGGSISYRLYGEAWGSGSFGWTTIQGETRLSRR